MYEFDYSRSFNHASRGENHAHAKLSVSAVKDIKARFVSKQATQTQLAREYGVSQNAIWRIVHGVTWNDGGQDDANN
jgi:hypothetical protein